jgi:soluble lytic murein transglycosylase-like protein
MGMMLKNLRLIPAAAAFYLCVSICPAALFPASRAAAKYGTLVRTLSTKHGVPEDLVHSIIRAESNYDPNAVSRKGAIGLMQLMPGTALEYGVEDPSIPEDNLSAGIQHLKKMMGLYNGDVKLALAAYNAGPAAVEKYGGVPPYPETRNYIERISRNYRGPVIRKKKITTFTDNSGRIVLTNMPYLNRNRLISADKKNSAVNPGQK